MSEETTNVETTEATEAITEAITVDGVDLSTLTADQLAALAQEEWDEFYTVVLAALKARGEDQISKLKTKIKAAADTVLPVIKYTAGAAVVLKVFGII
ncbi:hypothetical protein [Sporomusa aerivorans]|uniref:hypothetical protein n=1 Tax=Sporomusa aerivorans TaxID=204936 RepID=UPI003529F2E0